LNSRFKFFIRDDRTCDALGLSLTIPLAEAIRRTALTHGWSGDR
jgi:hypothetical protein